MHKQAFVYVLACADNTYYVGFSRQLHFRLQQHFAGNGAFFTRRHKPLRLVKFKKAKSTRDEYKLWLEYATIFDVQSVGGYSKYLCDQHGYWWPLDPKPDVRTSRKRAAARPLRSQFVATNQARYL